MALILDGTNGLSDVDGTAGTPAIRGSDANTGIFFPAADTIAFAEGGVESMRLDSAGNVGIGTSSPAFVYTDDTTLTVNGKQSATGFRSALELGNNGSLGAFYFCSTSNAVLGSFANIPLAFRTNNTERARITSSGNLLVGTTSGSSLLSVGTSDNALQAFEFSSGTNRVGRILRNASSTTDAIVDFSNGVGGGTLVAQIRANGGIANFSGNNVNLSDRREKTNFAPAKSYLETICAIPVQTFNYIDQNHEEDPGLTLGVVAQDVQAVAPELVMESNWGTKEEPKMRLSIYQTDLQYALMKCIQEQQAIIQSLTARIEALENQT